MYWRHIPTSTKRCPARDKQPLISERGRGTPGIAKSCSQYHALALHELSPLPCDKIIQIMREQIDVRLESLAGSARPEEFPREGASPTGQTSIGASDSASSAAGKTFYLETFGCQMNEHDSEKVAGVLLQRGYSQVETIAAARWSSTTLAASAKKPRTKFSRGWVNFAMPTTEKLSASSAAWRSRRANKFSSARRG